LRRAQRQRILRFVTGQIVRTMRPRGVYYTMAALLALILALGASPVAGQVELTVTPTMVKGAAGAPLVIVEFSDYQ